MFTREMIAADVWWFVKHSHQKVVPSALMVTLSLVDGKLAVFVVSAPDIILDIVWASRCLRYLVNSQSLSTFAVKRVMVAHSISR